MILKLLATFLIMASFVQSSTLCDTKPQLQPSTTRTSWYKAKRGCPKLSKGKLASNFTKFKIKRTKLNRKGYWIGSPRKKGRCAYVRIRRGKW